MGMIGLESSGDFDNLRSLARKFSRGEFFKKLDQIGQDGVDALQAATPVRTGLASESWSYEIEEISSGKAKITWINLDVEGGLEVVILIQYGHATGTGGYVPGRDFINPAMSPIFEESTRMYWEEVNDA